MDLASAINLTQLNHAVNDHLRQQCQLRELGTGSYHKVYDILRPSGPLAVVRVARPCVTRDGVESEVATMKYLAACGLPVPKIYAWDSGTNAIGAGYIIMEKVPGRSAHSMWSRLMLPDKEKVVTQVVQYLLAAFQARFDQAGSLYLSHSIDTPNPFHVGPIVSHKFLDGPVVYSGQYVAEGIKKFRGPFSNTADWLSCSVRAEIFALKSECVTSFDANVALANMDAAVRLCSVYPGDNPVIPHTMLPHKPFSFRFADVSLKNIMIDETCQITGFINFERTTIAPLWACATVPTWLMPNEDADIFSIDGPSAEQIELCDTFFSELAHCEGGKEWGDAYKLGRDFRKCMNQLELPAFFWSRQTSALWVQDRFDWARNHPGVGLPNYDYLDAW